MTATLLPPRVECEAVTCRDRATHLPCCSSHERALCCRCYCRTHFVEKNKCRPEDHE